MFYSQTTKLFSSLNFTFRLLQVLLLFVCIIRSFVRLLNSNTVPKTKTKLIGHTFQKKYINIFVRSKVKEEISEWNILFFTE